MLRPFLIEIPVKDIKTPDIMKKSKDKDDRIINVIVDPRKENDHKYYIMERTLFKRMSGVETRQTKMKKNCIGFNRSLNNEHEVKEIVKEAMGDKYVPAGHHFFELQYLKAALIFIGIIPNAEQFYEEFVSLIKAGCAAHIDHYITIPEPVVGPPPAPAAPSASASSAPVSVVSGSSIEQEKKSKKRERTIEVDPNLEQQIKKIMMELFKNPQNFQNPQ